MVFRGIVLQRLLWSFIHIGFISCTIYMVTYLWRQFLIHPTVTSLVSSTYPVSRIPFPAIAVCSMNKVSKKRAQNLATRIANKTNRNYEEIMTYMPFIGQLHDFHFKTSALPKLLDFQTLVDDLGMSVIDLVKETSIPCDELLRSCFWRNVQVDCSNVFRMRLTQRGYCCAFNEVEGGDEESIYDQINENPLTTGAGIGNGLYVSLNNHLHDYFYTSLSSYGITLHVYLSGIYPDKISGSLTEILTQPNSENFIEIVPTTLSSVPDVAHYAIEKRGCLLNHEMDTGFHSIYSQSACNVDCRMKSIQAMCQCIPFMVPYSNRNTVCSFTDIPCLHKYKEKWSSLYPYEGDIDNYLEKEKQDSLQCDTKCYPPCGETRYDAIANSFPIYNETEQKKNITRVYFYYLNRFSSLYRQDIVYYWFEALSNFGGIFGIFIGWSLISMLQCLVYYFKVFRLKFFVGKRDKLKHREK